MGTWDAGPFENDAAMDFTGEIVDQLVSALDEFMESPEIDETFDAAFAAIGLLNAIMGVCSARPYKPAPGFDAPAVRSAMVKCFDEQIDGMEPEPTFKTLQREMLIAALETFVGFCKR